MVLFSESSHPPAVFLCFQHLRLWFTLRLFWRLQWHSNYVGSWLLWNWLRFEMSALSYGAYRMPRITSKTTYMGILLYVTSFAISFGYHLSPTSHKASSQMLRPWSPRQHQERRAQFWLERHLESHQRSVRREPHGRGWRRPFIYHDCCNGALDLPS